LLDEPQDDQLTAADRLVVAISSQRNAESTGPDIVLGFDEAHVLSKKSGNIDASAFLGLRQALRKMQKVNISTVLSHLQRTIHLVGFQEGEPRSPLSFCSRHSPS